MMPKHLGSTTTKRQLIEEISRELGLSNKMAARVVNSIMEFIAENLKQGNKVQFTAFGTFELRKRAPRKGINPKTGKELDIKAKRCPLFRPGKNLKEMFS